MSQISRATPPASQEWCGDDRGRHWFPHQGRLASNPARVETVGFVYADVHIYMPVSTHSAGFASMLIMFGLAASPEGKLSACIP